MRLREYICKTRNFSNNNKSSLLFSFPLIFFFSFSPQLHGQILTETIQVHISFPKISKIPLSFSGIFSFLMQKKHLLNIKDYFGFKTEKGFEKIVICADSYSLVFVSLPYFKSVARSFCPFTLRNFKVRSRSCLKIAFQKPWHLGKSLQALLRKKKKKSFAGRFERSPTAARMEGSLQNGYMSVCD